MALPDYFIRDQMAARHQGQRQPERCWYCAEPATLRCTQKMAGVWIAHPAELARYSLIQDVDMQWYMVDSIERANVATPGCPWLNDEVFVVKLIHRHRRIVPRILRPLLPVLELKNAPCDRPSCETHARETGDEQYQCWQHWYEDEPLEPGELELNRQWAGLLETAVEFRRKEARKR